MTKNQFGCLRPIEKPPCLSGDYKDKGGGGIHVPQNVTYLPQLLGGSAYSVEYS